MEVLKFDKNGQWSLEKQYAPSKTNDGGIETPRVKGEPDNDFKAYHSTAGQLREDHGQKGQVHGNPGNKRAPKQGMPAKNQGKPAMMLPSSAANSNPGLGV